MVASRQSNYIPWRPRAMRWQCDPSYQCGSTDRGSNYSSEYAAAVPMTAIIGTEEERLPEAVHARINSSSSI